MMVPYWGLKQLPAWEEDRIAAMGQQLRSQDQIDQEVANFFGAAVEDAMEEGPDAWQSPAPGSEVICEIMRGREIGLPEEARQLHPDQCAYEAHADKHSTSGAGGGSVKHHAKPHYHEYDLDGEEVEYRERRARVGVHAYQTLLDGNPEVREPRITIAEDTY